MSNVTPGDFGRNRNYEAEEVERHRLIEEAAELTARLRLPKSEEEQAALQERIASIKADLNHNRYDLDEIQRGAVRIEKETAATEQGQLRLVETEKTEKK